MPYHFLFSTAELSPCFAMSTDWSRLLTKRLVEVTSCPRQSVGSATMTSQTWRMTWPTCGRPAVTSGESYAFCVQWKIFFTVWEISRTEKLKLQENYLIFYRFHKTCVQRFADTSGYFFKCPLCNNKDDFIEEMKRFGIYVPEKDADWEKPDRGAASGDPNDR